MILTVPGSSGLAQTRAPTGVDQDAEAALAKLYETTPAAKMLASKATGILIFPNIVKAGFLIGGQYGEGALRKGGNTVGHYNITSASYGLQAGAQSFGYAMFFMTKADLAYLGQSAGWELGVGPSVVAVDAGMAKTLTTTTARAGIYAFIFGQRGLMAGLGLQGSKISKIVR